ncbi:helix-turn-helix domain-containing protein [Vibrio sp. TBV020]|uniref:helix-turn-helix domain-containing protein n=1 Tax=Vibrio sp. TBV020 TaxID=3137398 RepID=UPI0038CD8836
MPKHHPNDVIHVVHKDHVDFFVSLFKEIDDNIYTLLRQAQIPNDINTSQADYRFLPETTLKNLMQILASKTSNEDFGVLIWSTCKNVYIPEFVKQLTQCNTLKEALDEFGSILKTQSTNANVYTQHAGGKWWLVREKAGADEIWFKYAEMFSVVFMCELVKNLTDDQWRPTEIGIQSPESEEFSNLPELKQAIFFTERPVTALYIPDEIMLAPISLPSISHKDREQAPNLDFLSSFKLAIKPYLSMGKLPIKIAAEILNLNVRTIQRRLAREGVTYSDIIEEMVLEQMTELLKCDTLPITMIATKMGYSDSAHFTRAFKRLMNMTPREYRKRYSPPN